MVCIKHLHIRNMPSAPKMWDGSDEEDNDCEQLQVPRPIPTLLSQ